MLFDAISVFCSYATSNLCCMKSIIVQKIAIKWQQWNHKVCAHCRREWKAERDYPCIYVCKYVCMFLIGAKFNFANFFDLHT